MTRKQTRLNLFLVLACLLAITSMMIGCKDKKPAPSTSANTAQKPTPYQTTTAKTEKTATDAKAAVVSKAKEQTMCPIMAKPIDKTIFVEYKGKKVYFCCKDCLAKFNADPEKYVSKLPQFQP